ncbi:MAG: LPS export ABC transporter periplasmic protein LptC [Candidatus Methylumidiphilus sp.]
MVADRKAIATNLALAMLAAVSWWLAESLSEKEVAIRKVDASQIDYYAQNITRTVLNPDGKPKEVLFAARMNHFKNDNHTEMDRPVMTLHGDGGEPWVIRSEQATAQAGGDAVLLNGQVEVTRKDSEGKEMKITTANVKYVPDQDYAETAEALTMESQNDTTSATGAQVYFEPVLKINLLANVRRKHEMR